MLRRGPGADDVGRAWVERNLPEQPKVVPPGVFVCAADGRLLGHLPYRAPPADWLRLLEAISGVAQGTPFRDARPALARLEVRVCMEELLRLIPDYEIDEAGLERTHNPNVRGFTHVPVTFTPHS